MNDLLLSPLEARVLAVLIEKQKLVPDSYPLTLNYLVSGCNQKSARSPLMELNDAEVQMAVDNLRHLSLVMESSGGRVMRYAHNADKVLRLSAPAVAIIATLALRGAQTSAEIRTNCGRMYDFADISSVESYLVELKERPAGALVHTFHQPGTREPRWCHLLCGEPTELPSVAVTAVKQGATADVGVGELATLKVGLANLKLKVDLLQESLDRVLHELGMEPTSERAPKAD